MPSLEKMPLLLVEDSEDDLFFFKRLCKKAGVTNPLVVATDGQQAVNILTEAVNGRQPIPQLIFLDLKLPKVDGIEVLRQVKGDERTRRIPIVLLTSSAEERDLVESYDLGVNSYVVKPIDFDAFAKTIIDLGFYWLAVNKRST